MLATAAVLVESSNGMPDILAVTTMTATVHAACKTVCTAMALTDLSALHPQHHMPCLNYSAELSIGARCTVSPPKLTRIWWQSELLLLLLLLLHFYLLAVPSSACRLCATVNGRAVKYHAHATVRSKASPWRLRTMIYAEYRWVKNAQ